jgi:hypothetical protein
MDMARFEELNHRDTEGTEIFFFRKRSSFFRKNCLCGLCASVVNPSGSFVASWTASRNSGNVRA